MKIRKQEYGTANMVGKNIEKLRKERGIKQKDFIAKIQVMGCDINPTSYSKLEGQLRSATDKEIYVAGGGSIYKQLLPYCKTAYVTKIDRKYDADVCFPNLDEDAEWELAETSEEQIYFDTTYHFMKYERVQN